MSWALLVWASRITVLACSLVQTSQSISLPANNASLWLPENEASNSSQFSVPLPDQQHLDRFRQLSIKVYQPEYHVMGSVLESAYMYLYVLEKLWQIPGTHGIGDELNYASDNPEANLRVTFRRKPGAPFIMTTEHAAWAVVNVLRRFRQDKTGDPRSYFWKSFNWEISVGNNVLGYMDTTLDFRLHDNGTVGTTSNRNVTVSDANIGGSSSASSQRPLPTSADEVYKREQTQPDALPAQNATNAEVENQSEDYYPGAQPRAIQIKVEFTSKVQLAPRDIADLLQFLSTFLMERAATDTIPYHQQHYHFDDENAITMPLLTVFYTGGDAGSGRETPSSWRTTCSDVVYGLRQVLLYMLKTNQFYFFQATIYGLATAQIASVEILPLRPGKQRTTAGVIGNNVTEYS